MESDILLKSCVLTMNLLFPVLHEEWNRRVSHRYTSLCWLMMWSRHRCWCMPQMSGASLSLHFFFYLLHKNPRVIPTTAFHIHGQTTEWRHIHVCFGSRIHIFMIWEPYFSSVQAAKVWIGVVCFSIKDVSLSIARRRKFDLLCLL